MSSIEGIEEIEKAYESIISDDATPSFLIDYFSRKKMIFSAKNILQTLNTAKIITTASENISIDRKQRLFPDLLLFSEEERKVIILEIKRSSKTTRETITEMLSYDHEVRNLLPFMPDLEISFCIVSTEYPTLLEHSIVGLSTWNSRQILCLRVEDKVDEKLRLKTHMPSAWTSLGNNNFSSDSITTANITLYIKEEHKDFRDAEAAVSCAINLIAKEGDRNNSHGFVFVWHDCWNLKGTAEFHLKIGFLNPYAFLPMAHSEGFVDASKSPLGQYLLDYAEDCASSYLCQEVIAKAIEYLNQYFHVYVEGLSNWDNERLRPWEIYGFGMLSMRHRALPLRIELWGVLGDFSREFITHQGAKKHILSKFSRKAISYEDPFIGIPLIDSISGVRDLDKNGFTCRSLFDFGTSLGALCSLYYTAIFQQKENNNLRNLPASITWYSLDLQATLLELTAQYKSSTKITIPPPTLKIALYENFEEALSSTEEFAAWMNKNFFDSKTDIPRICFNLGLITHPLLDEYFDATLPQEKRDKIQEDILATSENLLELIVSTCMSEHVSKEVKKSVINTILESYLERDFISVTKESLLKSIKEISKKKHVALHHTVLIDLLDIFLIPVNYTDSSTLNPFKAKFIDWVWIREEVLRFRNNGIKLPAVKIFGLGGFGIVDISENEYYFYIFEEIDLDKDFILVISNGMQEMAVKHKWADAGITEKK